MPSSFVVDLAVFSQICVDLSKADWVACIEELGQCAVRALVFSLGCRGETSNSKNTLAGEPGFSSREKATVVGGERIAIVGKDFLRFAVGSERCGQYGACVSTVFWQGERCGSDIESAGIIDNLVNRDMCVGMVKEAIDQSIDLPEFTDEIAGEALIGAAGAFAGIGINKSQLLQLRGDCRTRRCGIWAYSVEQEVVDRPRAII